MGNDRTPQLRNAAATTVDEEIEAMAAAVEALEKLDHAARNRAMNWLRDRLRSTDEPPF